MEIFETIDKVKNQSATDQELWAFVGYMSSMATLIYSDVFGMIDAYSGNPEYLTEVSDDIRLKIDEAITLLKNCQHWLQYHEEKDFHYGLEGVIVLLLNAKAFQGCRVPMDKAIEYDGGSMLS